MLHSQRSSRYGGILRTWCWRCVHSWRWRGKCRWAPCTLAGARCSCQSRSSERSREQRNARGSTCRNHHFVLLQHISTVMSAQDCHWVMLSLTSQGYCIWTFPTSWTCFDCLITDYPILMGPFTPPFEKSHCTFYPSLSIFPQLMDSILILILLLIFKNSGLDSCEVRLIHFCAGFIYTNSFGLVLVWCPLVSLRVL